MKLKSFFTILSVAIKSTSRKMPIGIGNANKILKGPKNHLPISYIPFREKKKDRTIPNITIPMNERKEKQTKDDAVSGLACLATACLA